jgi:predicted Zn-dependent protease
LGYTKTLLDARQPSKARDILRKYSRHHEPDVDYYNLLAQAEAQTGHAVDAEIAKAEYYYLVGDTKLAIDRLKYAQQKLQLDFYQQERMSARQAQLEYEFELEQEIKL